MDKKILDYFQKNDTLLYQTTTQVGDINSLSVDDPSNYFLNLIEAIISQQLSGKAADSIFSRFKKIFPNDIITPQYLVELPEKDIRSVGISYAKIKYLKDLSTKVIQDEIDLEYLSNLSDESVISVLTRVKGIGRWTAEMFLIFTLGREDIFSLGDLGLRTAFKRIYQIENPTNEQINQVVNKWSPYKSYGSLVLWKSLNNR